MIEIPRYVKKVLNTLEESGFEAFVVGGCVRDGIMGKNPSDWDVCTSAAPNLTQKVFSGIMPTIPTGIKHGTVTVLSDNMPIEVTTFRVDGGYSDSRRPDDVSFVSDINIDLSRRDFTINSMAYNEARGLIDPFGGREDIKKKIIRCVGDPEKRFSEDALRIIRALRFSAVCGFEIEADTAAAARALSYKLCGIAAERIYAELKKLLLADSPSRVLIKYRDIFERILPECFGSEVFDAEMCVAADYMPKDFALRLAAVCAVAGDDIGLAAGRLKPDLKTKRRVCKTVKSINALPPVTKAEALRFVKESGAEAALDTAVFNSVIFGDEAHKNALKIIQSLDKDKDCWSLKQLKANGADVIAMGISGRNIGDMLEKLLDEVIDGRCENNRGALLSMAERIISNKT